MESRRREKAMRVLDTPIKVKTARYNAPMLCVLFGFLILVGLPIELGKIVFENEPMTREKSAGIVLFLLIGIPLFYHCIWLSYWSWKLPLKDEKTSPDHDEGE